jgi:hypothetical protein
MVWLGLAINSFFMAFIYHLAVFGSQHFFQHRFSLSFNCTTDHIPGSILLESANQQ